MSEVSCSRNTRSYPVEFAIGGWLATTLLKQYRLAVPLLQRTEQAVFCYDSHMRGLADIYLDVRGGDIIVDLPGTRYTVTYHKPAVSPQLLAAYLPG
jgi:hypothetical protein